jgi:glycosyltransferase involved in cell wall biosynthesis
VRDAIVLSTWSWRVNNVPERIAQALAGTGAKILYCEMPVSRFRQRSSDARQIESRIFGFRPEYLGEKFSAFRPVGNWQWRKVARTILGQAEALQLSDPVFIYSHIEHIAALCAAVRQSGLPLVHVCMDYPEPYQYELIELSDQTWVIPKTVFAELRAKYGEKTEWIPQSIHFDESREARTAATEPAEWSATGWPRLGYLGPLQARVNAGLVREVLARRPQWQLICFGGAELIPLRNVHSQAWTSPEELPNFIAGFDVGVMPYDLSNKKNLHCVPLKLFDYFAAGMPVVSTRVLSLAEFNELIYFGDTTGEFIAAIETALAEPATSPKREERKRIAREHSTEALGKRLAELMEGLHVPNGVGMDAGASWGGK